MFRQGWNVCKKKCEGLCPTLTWIHPATRPVIPSSLNWEHNVKASMTAVYSLMHKAVLIILVATRVFKWSAIAYGLKKGMFVSLAALFWHMILWTACFRSYDSFAASSLSCERKDSFFSPSLFLSALLMSDRCVLSKTMLDTWSAGWAVFVPPN